MAGRAPAGRLLRTKYSRRVGLYCTKAAEPPSATEPPCRSLRPCGSPSLTRRGGGALPRIPDVEKFPLTEEKIVSLPPSVDSPRRRHDTHCGRHPSVRHPDDFSADAHGLLAPFLSATQKRLQKSEEGGHFPRPPTAQARVGQAGTDPHQGARARRRGEAGRRHLQQELRCSNGSERREDVRVRGPA